MLRDIRNIFYSIVVVSLITAGVSTNTYAAEKKDAPLLIPGTIKVFAEDVLDLADKTQDLLIIDARILSDRIQGYIEGSISLPDTNTSCETLAKVIPKKKTPVLFYCNGVKCGRSVNSSRTALECGYSNIYWFRGGYEEWKAKQLPFIKS